MEGKRRKTAERGKRAFYFSAEFLVGRAVYNNLLAMKMTGEVNEYLRGAGADLSALEEIEDAASRERRLRSPCGLLSGFRRNGRLSA